MKRDVESFADFVQYYQNKFVLSRTDGKKMYAVGSYADHERRTVSMTAYRSGRMEAPRTMTEQQVWDEVVFGLPSVGMTVFYRHELVYLYYRTQRNGGRGYGLDRVVYHSFNGYPNRQNGLHTVTKESLGQAGMAWQALTQRHLGLDVAWRDFTSESPKRLAYALSPQFGVYLSAKEYPALCYKMFEIGEVRSPTKVILLEKHREYRELVQRGLTGIEVEVR